MRPARTPPANSEARRGKYSRGGILPSPPIRKKPPLTSAKQTPRCILKFDFGKMNQGLGKRFPEGVLQGRFFTPERDRGPDAKTRSRAETLPNLASFAGAGAKSFQTQIRRRLRPNAFKFPQFPIISRHFPFPASYFKHRHFQKRAASAKNGPRRPARRNAGKAVLKYGRIWIFISLLSRQIFEQLLIFFQIRPFFG